VTQAGTPITKLVVEIVTDNPKSSAGGNRKI